MILSFHKKPGAFVDREFPHGITSQLKIDDTEQNKVYSLHRMRNTKPNFLFIKAKGVQIASFYSGFDTKQFIGRPNQCVSIILDSKENPTIWEDQLRRLTYDLLPKLAEIRDDEIVMTGLSQEPKYQEFDDLLAQKFEDLKEGRIEPMPEGYGEHKEGEGAVIEKISGLARPNIPTGVKNVAKRPLSQADLDQAIAASQQPELASTPPQVELDPIAAATKQMEEMENEGLRNEIRKLHEMLQDKENQVRALGTQLREAKSCESTIWDTGNSADFAKMKGEYEAILATKEQELDTWREKVAQMNEELFINQDSIRKTTEMMMQMTEDAQNQAQKLRELRAQIKALEANQSAPTDLSQEEVNTLRSHAAELEQQMKDLSLELEEKKTQNKSLFMQNKTTESKLEELSDEVSTIRAQLAESEQKVLRCAELDQDVAQKSAEIQAKNMEIQNLKQQMEQVASVSSDAGEQVQQLQEALAENNQLKMQIQILSSQQSPVVSSSDENLTRDIESLKKELITAKKTIKVQRREIDNLQKLLGL